MSGLVEAVVATKIGYEVDEKSMHENDMIMHAEVITSAHDEVLEALAKAKMFDHWIESARSGNTITIDSKSAELFAASVGFHVGQMLEPALQAKEEELHQQTGPKI